MADDKFPLSLWGDGDEIPGRAQVRVSIPVLRPATREDFDLLLQRLLGGSSSSSSRVLLLWF